MILICVEIMLNAVNLSLATFAWQLQNIEGIIAIFFIIVVAAAEKRYWSSYYLTNVSYPKKHQYR